MIFKIGPRRVKAAYGLFTKAIKKLEAAYDRCQAELGVITEDIITLEREREATLEASANARHAITNITKLIGG